MSANPRPPVRSIDGHTLRPMTLASLEGVVALETEVYAFPWTRGNFVDSLAAGYTAWTLNGNGGELLAYCVAMRGAVQEDREPARGFGVEQLRQPGRDHPGQDVARAAGRHAGISGRIEERLSLRGRDHGTVTLQHDVDVVGRREIGCHLNPVALHILDR